MESAIGSVRPTAAAAVDIFQKCRDFTRAREIMASGLYPYFTEISSAQETEVTIGRPEDSFAACMQGCDDVLPHR